MMHIRHGLGCVIKNVPCSCIEAWIDEVWWLSVQRNMHETYRWRQRTVLALLKEKLVFWESMRYDESFERDQNTSKWTDFRDPFFWDPENRTIGWLEMLRSNCHVTHSRSENKKINRFNNRTKSVFGSFAPLPPPTPPSKTPGMVQGSSKDVTMHSGTHFSSHPSPTIRRENRHMKRGLWRNLALRRPSPRSFGLCPCLYRDPSSQPPPFDSPPQAPLYKFLQNQNNSHSILQVHLEFCIKLKDLPVFCASCSPSAMALSPARRDAAAEEEAMSVSTMVLRGGGMMDMTKSRTNVVGAGRTCVTWRTQYCYVMTWTIQYVFVLTHSFIKMQCVRI